MPTDLNFFSDGLGETQIFFCFTNLDFFEWVMLQVTKTLTFGHLGKKLVYAYYNFKCCISIVVKLLKKKISQRTVPRHQARAYRVPTRF